MWSLLNALGTGLSENRKTPQDATYRRKTPQNAHSYETPMYYGMFHTLMYEWKPIDKLYSPYNGSIIKIVKKT